MSSRDRPKRNRVASTKGGRLMKLAGMTTNIAGHYTSGQLKRLFGGEAERDAHKTAMYRAIGDELADTLGEMKGAVMKVGQMASHIKDILPEEIAEALEGLRQQAPAMPFSQIEDQLQRELGAGADELFASLDEEPFAAASIGQVHRARTHEGDEVIVKIQYPGIADSCDSDLSQLKFVLRFAGLVKVEPETIDALFEEIRARVLEELDYLEEASNLEAFREYYADNPSVVVPKVFRALSSARVLTMSYEPGDSLGEVRPPAYDQATIDALGQRLFDLLGYQIFHFRALHSDPHPGNFAFRPDGTLVVYDFGCVKKLSTETVRAYRDAVKAGLAEDYAALDEALMRLGIRKPDGPAVASDYYRRWRDIFVQPITGDAPYDFGSTRLHEEVMKQSRSVLQHLDSFQPSAETLFIDRVVGGHYWNLAQLGVRAQFRPQVEALLALEPGG